MWEDKQWVVRFLSQVEREIWNREDKTQVCKLVKLVIGFNLWVFNRTWGVGKEWVKGGSRSISGWRRRGKGSGQTREERWGEVIPLEVKTEVRTSRAPDERNEGERERRTSISLEMFYILTGTGDEWNFQRTRKKNECPTSGFKNDYKF